MAMKRKILCAGALALFLGPSARADDMVKRTDGSLLELPGWTCFNGGCTPNPDYFPLAAPAKPSTYWMLVSVGQGGSAAGSVSNSFYPNEHLCDEAKSLATQGRTLEQVAADDKAAAERYEKLKKQAEASKSHSACDQFSCVDLNPSSGPWGVSTNAGQTISYGQPPNAQCIGPIEGAMPVAGVGR
jgi:hypothetical protein